MTVSTFIRFQDDRGIIHYGEPSQRDLAVDLIGATVKLLEGDPFDGGLRPSTAVAKVAKVGEHDAGIPLIPTVSY